LASTAIGPEALCPSARTVGQKDPVQLMLPAGLVSGPGGGHPPLESVDVVVVVVPVCVGFVENEVENEVLVVITVPLVVETVVFSDVDWPVRRAPDVVDPPHPRPSAATIERALPVTNLMFLAPSNHRSLHRRQAILGPFGSKDTIA
jgi:hypothetical protein